MTTATEPAPPPAVTLPPPGVSPADRLRRTGTLAVLVLAGVGLYFWTGHGRALTLIDPIVAVVAAMVGLLPIVSIAVDRLSRRLDALSPGRHALFVAVLAGLVVCQFVWAAHRGNRLLVPFIHDEQMYLLQARMLASGHLAMPQHQLADFFDTFYVFVRPVYASMYFPGTALAYVPAVWLGLPWIAWPLAITTAATVMFYLLTAKLLGRLVGVAAVFCFLSIDPMNFVPTMTLSHPLGALQGMTVLYAWLKWRERPPAERRAGWAVLCGAAAGFMAVTRPLESLAFGLPVLAAVAAALTQMDWRRWAVHAGAAALAATPFLALQLADDKAVTGHYTQLPIQAYVAQEFRGIAANGRIGGEPPRSTSALAQKQSMAAQVVIPSNEEHAHETLAEGLAWRTRMILFSSLDHPLLLLLLPLALPLAWADARWRVVATVAVTYTLAYLNYSTYLPHYSVQVAPACLLLSLGGVAWLTGAYPGRRAVLRSAYLTPVVALAVLTIFQMPYNAFAGDQWRQMDLNYRVFPPQMKKPALLFYKFNPGTISAPDNSPHIEPVYNLEAAWPDDATIVRLHDLGRDRNLEALEYYAERQPNREVYQFDRSTWRLTDLGNVADLARTVRLQIETAGKAAPATRPEG